MLVQERFSEKTADEIIAALFETRGIHNRMNKTVTDLPLTVTTKRLVNSPAHRKLIAESLGSLAQETKGNYDYFHSTNFNATMFGSLAACYALTPFLLEKGGVYHEYMLHDIVSPIEDVMDGIVAASMTVIPFGVRYADIMQKQFAYLVDDPKNPGRKILVGDIKKGSKILLMCDEETGASVSKMKEDIESTGLIQIGYCDIGDQPQRRILKVKGLKNGIDGCTARIITDIVGTGEKLTYQISKARKLGIVIDDIYTIFDFGLNCAKAQLSGQLSMIDSPTVRLLSPCNIHSLANLHQLHKKLFTSTDSEFTPDQLSLLWDRMKEFDERMVRKAK